MISNATTATVAPAPIDPFTANGKIDMLSVMWDLNSDRLDQLNRMVRDKVRDVEARQQLLKDARIMQAKAQVKKLKAETPDPITWNVDHEQGQIELDGYRLRFDETNNRITLDTLDDQGNPTGERLGLTWTDRDELPPPTNNNNGDGDGNGNTEASSATTQNTSAAGDTPKNPKPPKVDPVTTIGIDTNGDGEADWQTEDRMSFVLEDGTKLSLAMEWDEAKQTRIPTSLTITKGDQAIEVTGMSSHDGGSLNISDPAQIGRDLDANTLDGHVVTRSSSGWQDSTGQVIANNRSFGTAPTTVDPLQPKRIASPAEVTDFFDINGIDMAADVALTATQWQDAIDNVTAFAGTLETQTQNAGLDLTLAMTELNQTINEELMRKAAGSIQRRKAVNEDLNREILGTRDLLESNRLTPDQKIQLAEALRELDKDLDRMVDTMKKIDEAPDTVHAAASGRPHKLKSPHRLI